MKSAPRPLQHSLHPLSGSQLRRDAGAGLHAGDGAGEVPGTAQPGCDPEIFANAALIALLSGVIEARLSHVIENWHQYSDPSRSVLANFREAINIAEGGLTYYGGFLMAMVCCIAYGLWKRIPIRLGMDILAPCIMIGLGFGRIGCFLNGCCLGLSAICRGRWSFPTTVTRTWMSTRRTS